MLSILPVGEHCFTLAFQAYAEIVPLSAGAGSQGWWDDVPLSPDPLACLDLRAVGSSVADPLATGRLWVLFVGDDWAEAHHDVEVVDEAGRRLVRRRLPEGVAGVAALHEPPRL